MPFLAPIGAAIGGLITSFGGFLASGTFLAGLAKAAISIGLNLAVSALFGQPTNNVQGGVSLDVQHGGSESRIVRMGRFGVAGHYVFNDSHGASNKFYSQVFVLSDYYTTSLDRVFVDTEEVTLAATAETRGRKILSGKYKNKVWVKYFDGRQTTADSYLTGAIGNAGRWGSDHKGIGVSYVIVTMQYDRENLNQPLNFLFEGKGAPLYDWRKDSSVGGSGTHRLNDVSTHEFSENPVVMEYNYRVGLSVNDDLFCGMKMPIARLPLDRYSIAANICDEISSGAARYRCAAGLDCNAQHGDNIDVLMRSCGGLSIRSIGAAFPVIGADQTPVATLTDDDLITDATVTFQRLRPADELINTIGGTFPDPTNAWASKPYKTATSNDLIVIDRRTKDLALNFDMIPYPNQAAQIAQQTLSENRFEATMQCTVRPRWQVLEPGDWIEFQSVRFGTRIYLVTDTGTGSITSEGPGNVVLSLQERSGAIYDGVGVVTPPIVYPPPTEPFRQTELGDFGVVPTQIVGADGRIAPAIRAFWTQPDDPTISNIILQYRVKAKNGQTQSDILERPLGPSVSQALLLEGVVSKTFYEVRSVLRSDPPRSFVPSEWVEVLTPDTPLNDVTVGLNQVKDDIYSSFESAFGEIDRIKNRIDILAGDASVNSADEYLNRLVVTKQLGDALARIVQEAQLRVDGDTALASLIDLVQAEVENVSAEGLFSIQVSVGDTPDPYLVRLTMLARATTAEAFVEAGQIIEIYDDGGTVKSRILMTADQFAVLNPSSENVFYPLVFEGGQLKLEVARIGEAIAEKFTTADGKVKIGTLAPGVSGLEITT